MSVTKSREWKWLPGMENTRGEICIGMEGGDLCFADTGMGTVWDASESYVPNLDDPATQGAIVFKIFEPLGIAVRTQWCVGGRVEPIYFVKIAGGGKYGDMGPDVEMKHFESMADAIRAVFTALESEDGR